MKQFILQWLGIILVCGGLSIMGYGAYGIYTTSLDSINFWQEYHDVGKKSATTR